MMTTAMQELQLSFKALADERRLEMLRLLHEGELSVGELARIQQMAQSGVSRSLGLLKRAGLVRSRRQGGWTYLRLNTEHPLVVQILAGEFAREELPEELRRRLREVLEERMARTRAFFDDHSESWDGLRRSLLDQQPSWLALDALVPRGLRVADLGTGTGSMLPRLVEAGCRVLALDASPRMLGLARARARELRLAGVDFLRGELEHLPLADGTLDAAMATLVLHHVARPGAAIAEMARVVRPGGSVVVIDLGSHDQEWLRQEQADYWLGFSQEEMLEWLRAARLESCRYTVAGPVAIPGPSGGKPAGLCLFQAVGRKPAGAVAGRHG